MVSLLEGAEDISIVAHLEREMGYACRGEQDNGRAYLPGTRIDLAIERGVLTEEKVREIVEAYYSKTYGFHYDGPAFLSERAGIALILTVSEVGSDVYISIAKMPLPSS